MKYLADMIEENGKTIRENNSDKKHEFPIGSLIEIHSEDDTENNGLRLFVVRHVRDCDMSPLYWLGTTANPSTADIVFMNHSEEGLFLVEYGVE